MLVNPSRLAALADPTRLAVFQCVLGAPDSVADIAAALNISSPAVSHHLKVLREAGLVEARRESHRVLYRASPDALTELYMFVATMRDRAIESTRSDRPPSEASAAQADNPDPESRDSIDERIEGWIREFPSLTGRLGRIFSVLSRISRIKGFWDNSRPLDARIVGMKPGDFDILGDLIFRGPPYEAMPSELHKQFHVTLPGLLKRINRLIQLGLVQRVRSRRGTQGGLVRLTRAGYELQKEILFAWKVDNPLRRYFDGLSDHELLQLSHLLRRIVATQERSTYLS